jgi:hypothetical protein
MKKLTLLLILPLAFMASLSAQSITIKGTVADTTNKKKIAHAVVLLFAPKDSALLHFVRTDANGSFAIKNVDTGRYVLQITQSLFADYVDEFVVGKTDIDLREVALTPKSKLLQEVIVKSGSPIKIKGDTVVYTADSFKVGANANVEELLKKLPGIQVDRNGEIKAMGEVVKKVLVDGEEFFGDDPGMAVKNLRADAVKEVQVYDKKSDQAEFSGVDDGERSKTINLKLKEDRKKGYFGKLEASGGVDNNKLGRYNNSAMINAFKGKRKMAGYVMTGNVGKMELNWRDEENFAGEGDSYSMSMDEISGNMNYTSNGGGDDGMDYISGDEGFSRNWNGGVHYSNKPNDKHSINGGAKYNKVQQNTANRSFQQTFLPDTSFSENTADNNFVNRQNLKFNGTYEWKIDSMNSVKLVSNVNFIETRSENRNFSDAVDEEGRFVNTSNKLRTNQNDRTNLQVNLLWRHKFKKPKRTLSLTTNLRYSESEADGYLLADNRFFENGIFLRSDSVDQFKTTQTDTRNLDARLSYTEPLWKNFYAELSYGLSGSLANNDRTSFAKTVAGKYEQRIDSLSNHFEQQITTHRMGVNLRYVKKKFNYTLGMAVATTAFALQDITLARRYHYDFINLFPSANLSYTIKQNQSLRFSYNGSTRQPSLNQLQPLRENNDPLSLYIGNPNLSQSFRHGFNFGYNSYNFIKEKSIWMGGWGSFTQNAITNKVSIDNLGRRVSQPVNVDGLFSVSLNVGLYGKLRKINTRYNLGPNVSVNRGINFINGLRNKSTNYSLGGYFGLNKGKDKKYDAGISVNPSWNLNQSSLSSELTRFLNVTTGLRGTWFATKNFEMGTDCDFNYRQRTSSFQRNNNNIVWNAYLSHTFLKKTLTARLEGFDLLNQNNIIDRQVSSNFLSENINQRLQRYFMLTFTWNFNKNGKPAGEEE